MPLVNTWIKNEDWDKYYQLASTKQWGEFVHNALNTDLLTSSSKPIIAEEELIPGVLTEAMLTKEFETAREAAKSPTFPLNTLPDGNIKHTLEQEERLASYFPSKAQTNGVCKIHGTSLDSRGKCLQKGCKHS